MDMLPLSTHLRAFNESQAAGLARDDCDGALDLRQAVPRVMLHQVADES